MMSLLEAEIILSDITVTPEQLERSKAYMLSKIAKSKKSGMYKKQGGVMFKFSDESIAWIGIWGKTLHLTERGETLYCGEDENKCAEMLHKLGIAHNIYGSKFLGCA